MKSRGSLVLLVLGYSVIALGAEPAQCTSEELLSDMTSREREWRLLQPNGEAASDFHPIARIASKAGRLWIATFRSDFHPVRATPEGDHILLEGLTFLLPSPNGADPYDAELTRFHGSDLRFTVKELGCECRATTLSLDVSFGDSPPRSQYVFAESDQ
jgi:hypothetical protein